MMSVLVLVLRTPDVVWSGHGGKDRLVIDEDLNQVVEPDPLTLHLIHLVGRAWGRRGIETPEACDGY